MRQKGTRFMDEYVHGNKSKALEMLQDEAQYVKFDNIEEPSDAFLASPSWESYINGIISDALKGTPQGYDDLCA